jgi:hypothetical protein
MVRTAGVETGGGVKDDGSRMTEGDGSGAAVESLFPGLAQGRLGVPKSRLFAFAYLTASLSHW